MSYKPTITKIGGDSHLAYYVWSSSKKIGRITWNKDWGCFVFSPIKDNVFFGPVFLSDVVTTLIELEAEVRKRICKKCGYTKFHDSTYIDAAGGKDICLRCDNCGERYVET